MKYFPFLDLKYLACLSSLNKKLKKKITPEYYLEKINILLYCIIFIIRQIKTLNNLNNKTIYTNNLFLNARINGKLFIILAAY